jgi:hypothetical protein
VSRSCLSWRGILLRLEIILHRLEVPMEPKAMHCRQPNSGFETRTYDLRVMSSDMRSKPTINQLLAETPVVTQAGQSTTMQD